MSATDEASYLYTRYLSLIHERPDTLSQCHSVTTPIAWGARIHVDTREVTYPRAAAGDNLYRQLTTVSPRWNFGGNTDTRTIETWTKIQSRIRVGIKKLQNVIELSGWWRRVTRKGWAEGPAQPRLPTAHHRPPPTSASNC